MSFFWKTYSLIFFAFAVSLLISIINPTSHIHVFYLTQFHLNSIYIIPFILNLIQNIFLIAAAIIVIFYAFNIPLKYFKSPIWILLRIIIDLTCTHYDYLTIKSAYYIYPELSFIYFMILITPILPSYFAHWLIINKSNSSKN